MIVGDVTRPPVPGAVGELEMLDGWLDYHRATLLWKCAGLDDAQLRLRACPPSTLSLLGLIRHMNQVEQGWFGRFVGADEPPLYSTEEWPDADFDDLDNADTTQNFAAFEQECVRSRERAATRELDDTFVSRRGETISLRWVYVHMVEEYARHNGHADLIREAIDGTTGD